MSIFYKIFGHSCQILDAPRQKLTKPSIVLSLLLATIGLMPFVAAQALPVIAPDAPALQKQRWQAVDLAKAGQLNAGIQQLETLATAHPTDPWITADLIVLLRRAGQNAAISQRTLTLQSSQIPSYAWIDWAKALRDEKQFVRAKTVLAPYANQLSLDGKILYAMILAEAGDFKAALAALPDRHTPKLTATNLANMAYVSRLAGKPQQGLADTEQALAMDPNNHPAWREQVFALSALQAADRAQTTALKHADWFSQQELDLLRANVATQQIRLGYNERRRLDSMHRYAERDILLERALASLQANRVAFVHNPALLLRTRYDEIYVLRELRRWHEAVTEFESLPSRPRQLNETELQVIPAYVRTAAAESYHALHNPQEAITLYQSVIQQNPGVDVDVYLSLYYAYLDAEEYQKGETLLAHLHKVTPTWIPLNLAAGIRKKNWERISVDQVWVMDPAYRNNEAVALHRAQTQVGDAPFNTGSITALATIQRWRGWPEQAQKTNALAAAYSPENKDVQYNEASNDRDLGANERWGAKIQALHTLFPKDEGIAKSYAAWQDRQYPSISSEYTTGKSRGNSTAANPVTGNRDQEWLTRLNSPWLGNWRAFLQHHWVWSSYDEGPISYNRVGAGAEWRHLRQHFWLMLENDQFTGQHVGVSAGWSQWLDDHWQYSISGNTYSTQTPLRANRAGLSGKSLNANLAWRQSESRSASLGLSVLDISDGNKRIDFSAGFTQRVLASPHHISSVGFDLFAEHNTLPGGAYFNPANSQSVNLRFEHQWITWRHYDRSLTQYFKVSPGYGWQDGFGGAPTLDVFYEHKWKFSRTWDLHYGVGWGSNVYDGGREGRLYGLIGFGGVF